jgi:hypothetical protein
VFSDLWTLEKILASNKMSGIDLSSFDLSSVSLSDLNPLPDESEQDYSSRVSKLT